ncbi:hypothetical protein EB796_024091 [Bugula neritina]|uniref:Uncharacterized protein n=1 Tax=Bugula neritina TaxID=10212 RepID=A0A7J7IUU1_BUGNE|nr:hypothetical protein EB796_024091 [Bugula neritina]
MDMLRTYNVAAIVVLVTITQPYITNTLSTDLSMAFTDMIVKLDWIYQDCRKGKLSNVTFTAKYSHGHNTFCMHTHNPLIPVEWTASVEALITFADTAKENYGHCIENRKCVGEIDLSNWKQLAREQYTACKYCNDSSETNTCSNYATLTQRDDVMDIVESMYLVTNYVCTVPQDGAVHVLHAQVDNDVKQNYSIIKIPQKSVRCKVGELSYVLGVTEQAGNYRIRIKESNNSDLIEKVQQALRQNLETLKIKSSTWTVQGGYPLKEKNPHSILIYYECITSLPGTADYITWAPTYSSAEVGKERAVNKSALTVIASAVVVCILAATIFALSLTIRNMKKHNDNATV